MNLALLSISTLKNHRESARITLLLLAKELVRQGHQVTIFARKVTGLPAYEVIEGIAVYRVLGIYLPLAVRKFQREKQTFDIIHSFSATPLFAFSSLFSKVDTKTKLIHTLKSYSKHPGGNLDFPLRFMDYITVPTFIFARKLKIHPEKLKVIHSPLDVAKFQPKNKIKMKIRYNYSHRKILFYYGALWPGKGVEIAIQALSHLIPRFPSIKLILAPRYPPSSAQKELIKKLKVGDYVDFVIEPPRIEEYVSLADVVVLPYLNLQGTEGNPSCLLEVMACKTAVVTSDLPELREIAEGCVQFSIPGDVFSLSQEITEALIDPKTTMIEKAFQVSQDFDVKKIAQEFLELYES